MRAKEFIEDVSVKTSTPTLHTDNPGGKWQEHEQLRSKESGTTAAGAPRLFGAITANFTGPVLIPVEMLSTVTGLKDEQNNVRSNSIEYLTNLMKTTGRLPDGTKLGREHVPFIVIGYDGIPWANEGNHRIMAAKKLGWNYLPTQVQYHAGGETNKGPWDPTHLLALDASLQGKPRFVTENRNNHKYQEIEFICANPEFNNASNSQQQQKLYDKLNQIPGVIPLRQDWDEGQISLTAIYANSKLRPQIINLAKHLGIQIDLERHVSDDYVDRAIRKEHPGQYQEGDRYGDRSTVPEASYPGNIGMMEVLKFFDIATPEEKTIFKQLVNIGKKSQAWQIIQQVTGVKLQGKEFGPINKLVDAKGVAEGITPDTIHKLADRKGVKWDNEPSFLRLTKRLTGKEHLDDLDQAELQTVKQYLEKQGAEAALSEKRVH